VVEMSIGPAHIVTLDLFGIKKLEELFIIANLVRIIYQAAKFAMIIHSNSVVDAN